MKHILCTLFALLAIYQTQAQKVDFQKLYSTTGPTNQGSDVVELSNGDFIVCGVRSVPMGGVQYIGNIILLRLDNKGDTVWTKEIGTATDRELALGMTQLPNSDLVIVGSINIPPDATTTDALIIRVDVNGNVIWQKRYGGSMQDYVAGVAVDNNHIIVCGQTNSYGAGDTDAWLLKLDMNGDTVWTSTFGGTAFDDSWDVVVVNGEYYIAGGTYSFANGQYDDAWIVKVDGSGKEVWKKSYGVQNKVDWAWALEADINNGIADGLVFVGINNTEENQPGNANGNLYFMKIDLAGNVVWNRTIVGTPWRREGIDIKQTKDRGFVIAGYKLEPSVQSQQLYVVRTNNAGYVMWDTAYGQSDSSYTPSGVTVTSDGGWIVTGAVFTPGQQIRYIFVTKFSGGGTSIETTLQEASDVIVFPNPAESQFYVKTTGGDYINRIIITNIDGRVVQDIQYKLKKEVALKILTQGNYIVDVYTENGVTRQKLLVK